MKITDLEKLINLIKLLSLNDDTKDEEDILSEYVGKKVLIRDHMAGVFVTTLTKIKRKEWVGAESRKIHYWSKAGAVEGISKTGIDLNASRVTVATEMSCGKELVQLCLLSDDQYNELMGAKVWNPK